MPGEAPAQEILSETIEGIPLYLIATTIAGEIRKKREKVFLITVERKKQHRYAIVVETRTEHALRATSEAPARTER